MRKRSSSATGCLSDVRDNPLIVKIDMEPSAFVWKELPVMVPGVLQPFLHRALLRTPYADLCPIEISLYLVDDIAIQTLNDRYRQKNRPTNVLSFPTYTKRELMAQVQDMVSQDMPILLGDIVLSWSTLVYEATENSLSLENHVMHLFLHGFFHLLGYDHEEGEEAAQMARLEKACLGERALLL